MEEEEGGTWPLGFLQTEEEEAFHGHTHQRKTTSSRQKEGLEGKYRGGEGWGERAGVRSDHEEEPPQEVTLDQREDAVERRINILTAQLTHQKREREKTTKTKNARPFHTHLKFMPASSSS